MIRILPLEQRANYDTILELYFYRIAMVTPFCPEDIFPTGTFHEKGDIQMPSHPVKDFYKVSQKDPRDRRRSPRYTDLLRDNNLPIRLKEEGLKDDAILAKRIIKKAFHQVPKNKSLYEFLYEGLPDDDFHVHGDRLRCLLTSYMDDESLKQAGLCFECPDPEKSNLFDVFRYISFAESKMAVQLMAMQEVSVCPYCNRNFTTTISNAKGGTRQGQFDHYRSKSQYPWFALSLRNLIPACGYCNQNKGDKKGLVLYPYKEGMEKYYRFRTRPVHGVSYLTGAPQTLDEFEVVGEKGPVPMAQDYDERIKNSLNFFHLNELYQTHQEHIAWIFGQRYIFSDSYLEHLHQTFPALFSSAQEARELLYLRHISPDRWGEHPLSKLTHDIDEEITELESHFSDGEK